MPTNADELHDALAWLGFVTAEEVARGGGMELVAGRARRGKARRRGCTRRAAPLWVAAERLPQFLALWPGATT